MAVLRTVLCALLMLVGSCAIWYCGIGSLIVLPDLKYHHYGVIFVCIPICGVAVGVAGFVILIRAGGKPPAQKTGLGSPLRHRGELLKSAA